MLNRHRGQWLLGLTALVGLCSAGCHPDQLIVRSGLPQPSARHSPSSLGSSVRLLPPQRSSVESAQVQTVAASEIIEPGVRPTYPMPPARTNVASAWRPMQRLFHTTQRPTSPEILHMPTTTGPPPLFPRESNTSTTELPISTEPEKLPAPRTNPQTAEVKSEVIVSAPTVVSGGHLAAGVAHPSLPREGSKLALPPYVIEPPDVVNVVFTRKQPTDAKNPEGTETNVFQGQLIVNPDGTVNLGLYGLVPLGGLTVEQARDAIAAKFAEKIKPIKDAETKQEKPLRDEVYVEVLAYNSKAYYVITDGGGYGEGVVRVPVTGGDTVLDAVSRIGGLHREASKKKIWVARANLGHPGHSQILPVDWVAITQKGQIDTNYQLAPGDRIYVKADARITIDNNLDKTLSPIERILGVTLLGSNTVNSIRFNRGVGGLGAGGFLGR